MFLVGICALCAVMLFSACAGVTTTRISFAGGTASITGIVDSVDTQDHRAILDVNGQQVTVTGLTYAQLEVLRTQQGKQFTIQVRRIGLSTYTISAGTDPTENDHGVPGIVMTTVPSNQNEPGTIEFIGKVVSVSDSSIAVLMPDGQILSMNMVSSQSDLEGFHGMLPRPNQMVSVKTITNADGSFMVSKLSMAKSDNLSEQNIVIYQGVTPSPIGPDRKLNFLVGNRSYSFQIGPDANLPDFGSNERSLGDNIPVKAKVLFDGSTGIVTNLNGENNSNN
jgi:hypothetical protein